MAIIPSNSQGLPSSLTATPSDLKPLVANSCAVVLYCFTVEASKLCSFKILFANDQTTSSTIPGVSIGRKLTRLVLL